MMSKLNFSVDYMYTTVMVTYNFYSDNAEKKYFNDHTYMIITSTNVHYESSSLSSSLQLSSLSSPSSESSSSIEKL